MSASGSEASSDSYLHKNETERAVSVRRISYSDKKGRDTSKQKAAAVASAGNRTPTAGAISKAAERKRVAAAEAKVETNRAAEKAEGRGVRTPANNLWTTTNQEVIHGSR